MDLGMTMYSVIARPGIGSNGLKPGSSLAAMRSTSESLTKRPSPKTPKNMLPFTKAAGCPKTFFDVIPALPDTKSSNCLEALADAEGSLIGTVRYGEPTGRSSILGT